MKYWNRSHNLIRYHTQNKTLKMFDSSNNNFNEAFLILAYKCIKSVIIKHLHTRTKRTYKCTA